MRGRRHVGTLIALVADRGSVAAGSRPTLLDALLLDFLIDLVIYFACVNAGQSPPVIAVLDQRSFSTFEVYLQAIKGASPVAKKGAVVFVAAHSTSIRIRNSNGVSRSLRRLSQ